MNKIYLLLLINLVILSCERKNIPKKVSIDILSTEFKQIDSVFDANRPITSFYLDSIIVMNPSLYFKDSKDFFNEGFYFIGDSKDYLPNNMNHFFDFRISDSKKKAGFVFTKNNNRWILKKVELIDNKDYSFP